MAEKKKNNNERRYKGDGIEKKPVNSIKYFIILFFACLNRPYHIFLLFVFFFFIFRRMGGDSRLNSALRGEYIFSG